MHVNKDKSTEHAMAHTIIRTSLLSVYEETFTRR